MTLLLAARWALTIALACYALYGPLAELLFHILHIGTIYRGDDLKREMTLTFDDGPHPDYTPQLLDLLDKAGARALFFLVGERAEAYPDLVRDIRARGHLVGSHTYRHVNSWLTTPWRMRREIQRSKAALEAILGEPVRYFRPPWGRFNLILPYELRRAGLRPVLWSAAARDWRRGDRARAIARRLALKTRNGAIFLLHDAGGAPGAPHNTLRALQAVLPRWRALELTLNTRAVEEAGEALARRRGSFERRLTRLVHPLWRVWETIFDALYRVHPLSRMFRLSLVPWRFGARTVKPEERSADPSGARPAAAVALPGSADRFVAAAAGSRTLVNGTPMVEIHLQNLALQELIRIDPPEKMVVRGLREVRDSLHDIALALVYDDRFRQAEGIFGLTNINRGMNKLGFHVEDVEPTPGNRWVMLFLMWLMILYHPQGYRRLKSGLKELQPRLIWMTRDVLLDRYAQGMLPARVENVEDLVPPWAGRGSGEEAAAAEPTSEPV